MLCALGRRHAAAAAAVAAGLSGLVATRRQSECDAAPAPHVTGVLVLFRHGARSPVWALPDDDGQVYDAVTTAPPHAPEVTISNARKAWGGNKNGLLTTVGWAQGEALGRHLRSRYGAPFEPPTVRSTDVMRTVLTAHAVITGLYAADAAAPDGIVIEVERRTALHAPLWCTPLATLMLEGREEARRDARSQCAYANLQAAYGGQRVAAIAVHDDCQARRFHAKAPSDAVDVALCDAATREAAREIATALANGGDETARLSAGPLCAQVGEIVRQLAASCNRERARPNMVLLSGHDTSLFQLLNALDGASRPVDRGWPPYAASIAVEVWSDDTVRVLYQFEPLAPPTDTLNDGAAANGAGAGAGTGSGAVDGAEPLDSFLRRIDALSISHAGHERLCKSSPGDGSSTFQFRD